MKRETIIVHFFVIIIISFLVYFNHFQNKFVYDDAVTIHRNFDIKDIKKTFSNFTHINTRPLVQVSYAFNYRFSRLQPLGYHLTNFIFHLGTALLIYWMIFNLGGKKTYHLPFFSALIFSLHPINTESVSYLSSRASIFLTFFYLLSVCFFIKGKELLKESKFLISSFLMAGVLLSFVAGGLSKTNIATLPIILIGINYFFYSSQYSVTVFIKENKTLLFILSALGLAGIYYGATHIPNVGADKYDSLTYLATQVVAVPLYYFRLFFFPFNMNIDPDFPVFPEIGLIQKGIAALIILFSLFFFIQTQNKSSKTRSSCCNSNIKKWLPFGLLWFVITLAPTSSFIPLNELVSEHRIYLPAVGLSIFLAALLVITIKNITKSFKIFSQYRFYLEFPVILLIILLFSLTVIERNFTWKNNERIWTDALKKSPSKARPYNEVGVIFFKQNELDKAEKHFTKAVELNPQYGHTLVNLGNLYGNQGNMEKAISKYKDAIKLSRPSSYYARIGLGNIYVKEKSLEKAKEEYQEAASFKPDHPLALYNLGRLHELLSEVSNAKSYYQKAIDVDPDFSLALNNLGAIYIHEGRYADAISILSRAIGVNQKHTDAVSNLGVAYHFKGELEKAELYYLKALDIDPYYDLARENLNKLTMKK